MRLPALKQGLKLPFNQTIREALAQSEDQYSEVLVQDFVPSHISNTNDKLAGNSGGISSARKSRHATDQYREVSHFEREDGGKALVIKDLQKPAAQADAN